MQLLNINELIPHSKNRYFFDDIQGEPWDAFLESIETSGVIEPIIATQDKVIVSGHQRVRACERLAKTKDRTDLLKVWVDIRTFNSDDEVLKQLIETNIRQRGVGNTNAVKLGRCIAELERIYGIKNGGDHGNQYTKADGHNVQLAKTQDDLAKELEMSKKQMSRLKSLTDLIPELQDAVQSGRITATTAMGFVKKLTPDEQRQLAEQITGADKVGSSDVQKYIDEIKGLRQKISADERRHEAKVADLERRLHELPVREKEVIREVVPDDYEKVKDDLNSYKEDNKRLAMERQNAVDEMNRIKSDFDELKNAKPASALKLEDDAEQFIIGTYEYIKRNGGFVYVSDKLDGIPDKKADEFRQAIFAIDAFAKQMIENIGGYEVGG